MLTWKQLVNVVIASALLLVVLLHLAAAQPDGQSSADADAAIDADAGVDADEDINTGAHLSILHDGFGHYVALEEGGTSKVFYYSDGKAFYKQLVRGYFSEEGFVEYLFQASNRLAAGGSGGRLRRDKSGQWRVSCGEKMTELVELPSKERDEIANRADFKAARWQRLVRFAARDEEGRYYVVDSERDGYQQGWRLFIGRPGKVKEVRLVDVVSDSGGEVFATARGDLSFERRNRKIIAVWSKGRRSTELTFVPPELNARLFYVKMGIYAGGAGTPCDQF